MNKIDIKRDFQKHFHSLLHEDGEIMTFFYEVFIKGSAYIVGGYFRDFLNQRKSRDIDVIVDISGEELLNIVQQITQTFSTNRQGGIKIQFQRIQMDVWSIYDNWAFKNQLVKLNEEDKLKSIAKGCFYNYDSLVINLNNFSYNLQFYREFLTTRKLDILQNRPVYKNLNPTTEANILRAFFVKQKYGVGYTQNTYNYLQKKVGSLNDSSNISAFDRLLLTRSRYPKYGELTDSIILKCLSDLKEGENPSNQLVIDI